MSAGRVRVLLWHRIPPDGSGAVEDAYHAISTALAGTPGLLGSELLRSVADPERVLVMSEWSSLADFAAWERGDEHKPTTAPLRPYRDRDAARPVEILEVAAAY